MIQTELLDLKLLLLENKNTGCNSSKNSLTSLEIEQFSSENFYFLIVVHDANILLYLRHSVHNCKFQL